MNKKHYYLDSLGLLSIGIFSLAYILFIKGFAEQHIQFSFLDFPVFVGEILLFICLLLFLAKAGNNIQTFTKRRDFKKRSSFLSVFKEILSIKEKS